MNSAEGAAATDENPGTQPVPGSSSNSHRPIHHTRSFPHFDHYGVEERRIHLLQVEEFEGRRSRSHSEPLTRDALKIAQELRKLSDLFNTKYEVSSPTFKREFGSNRRNQSRRVTLAGSGGETLRQEVNQFLANRDTSIKYNFDRDPLPPEGTPV